MRVLLDTNVIIDVLQNREPWCKAGKEIFLAIANRKLTGCVTTKQIADIHFISKKAFRGQECIDEKCRSVIAKLLSLFEVLDTLRSDCTSALIIENNDYEDAMLIAAAERCRVNCIVTRNCGHFSSVSVACYEPEELLKVLS